MISGEAFLATIRGQYASATMRQVFPYLRIRIIDQEFAGLDQEERESLFCDKINYAIADLRATSDRLFLRVDLLDSNEEDEPLSELGSTWLGTFADDSTPMEPQGASRVVHFYGFKGGQGRTTMLAFLANELARDGLTVLVADLDAEAPSLDLVLRIGQVPPEASLVGLRAGLGISPIPVSTPRGGGSVSLLAFRPTEQEFDLDATALAFEAGVHAPSQARLAATLRDCVAGKYDVILFDHRTGLGPTVPAWIRSIPGPVVVFDRLDGQSARATRDIGRMWREFGVSGAVVSYVSPAESPPTFREEHRGAAWPWLVALAGAKNAQAEIEVGPDALEDHWLLWPDDNAFRRRGIPKRDEVGGLTRESVARLREILALPEKSGARTERHILHSSGAADQGLFIATEALRALCQPGSTVRFIFGRKGTGKTRLLSELVQRGIGDPLVVAEDEKGGGLPTSSVDLRALVQRAEDTKDLDGLWWTLIRAALRAPNTTSALLLRELHADTSMATGVEVKQMIQGTSLARVFLIDGLETMTKSKEKARELIQALLRVASSLEQEVAFRSRVSLRIFLRSDIARWGFENFEQQSDGKRIELSWTAQTIFNFVLSRLPHLPWIARTFPDVIQFIDSHSDDVQEGAIPEGDALGQLLRIFPSKLGRLNLNTTTFLRTYFSDDPGGEANYYPRVYHAFLESVDRAATPLEKKRVHQDVILRAHDEASVAFLQQVRQELRFLTPMDDRDMDRLLNALNGRGTPFVVADLRRDIRNSLKLKMPAIDAAFNAMKDIGMFEQHPKSPNEWRVGRLFKSALKMKYRRE